MTTFTKKITPDNARKQKLIRKRAKAIGASIDSVLPTDTLSLNLLIKLLDEKEKEKIKKMRSKILHLLGVYGMTNDAGKLDLPRINEFVKHIGSNNPKKKILNFLNYKETHAVLNQVEAIVNKELKK